MRGSLDLCVLLFQLQHIHACTDNSRTCLCTQCKSCKHITTLHCLLVLLCPQKIAFGLDPECNIFWGFWACVWWASSINSWLQGRYQLCILIRTYNEIQPRGKKYMWIPPAVVEQKWYGGMLGRSITSLLVCGEWCYHRRCLSRTVLSSFWHYSM